MTSITWKEVIKVFSLWHTDGCLLFQQEEMWVWEAVCWFTTELWLRLSLRRFHVVCPSVRPDVNLKQSNQAACSCFQPHIDCFSAAVNQPTTGVFSLIIYPIALHLCSMQRSRFLSSPLRLQASAVHYIPRKQDWYWRLASNNADF